MQGDSTLKKTVILPFVTTSVLIEHHSDLDNGAKLLEHGLHVGFTEAVGNISDIQRPGCQAIFLGTSKSTETKRESEKWFSVQSRFLVFDSVSNWIKDFALDTYRLTVLERLGGDRPRYPERSWWP